MHITPTPDPSNRFQEGYVGANSTRLYYRVIGQGQPLIILHGEPDFGHAYLLPDMLGLSRRWSVCGSRGDTF